MKEQHVQWFWCIMWKRGGLINATCLPSLSSQCRPRKRWSCNGSFVCFFLYQSFFWKVWVVRLFNTVLCYSLTHTHTHAHTHPHTDTLARAHVTVQVFVTVWVCMRCCRLISTAFSLSLLIPCSRMEIRVCMTRGHLLYNRVYIYLFILH